MEALLKVSNLRVDLDGNTLIRNLSFELREKETLVILGPNGAGKTVLLRALLGLVPHQGEASWRPGIRFGYVPQRVPLNKELPMTVADFFALKKLTSKTAAALLLKVDITDSEFLEKQLGVLSFGQFQRVLIAWALANDPEVLLLDEPTAGVDVGGEDAVHALLHGTEADRAFAVILVSHDLTAVYREATRVLCMNQNRFCYGPPGEILDPKVLEEIYGRKIKFFEHSHH